MYKKKIKARRFISTSNVDIFFRSKNSKNSTTKLSGTLRKLVFHFLSNWMGYDRGDSFPFDFEPNGISFGSK